ncbi:type III-A CRISPR-associated protein Cas10/Csm1 [Fusobacterium sp. PH5-44]|uniref:type III-A CRISPR-associated protein Cas10/Csm1 n=1 Tax=unclassified Fusobacterium TaxID=2648384 RepID=UPI003D1C572B
MVNIKDNREKIALGSLIQDVGKILIKSNKYLQEIDKNGNFLMLSSWFVKFLVEKEIIGKDEEFINIIECAEKNKNSTVGKLISIIEQGSKCANLSVEDVKMNNEDIRRIKSLESIFSTIDIDKKDKCGNREKLPDKKYYKLGSFSYDEKIFPTEVTGNLEKEFDKLIDEFLADIGRIKTDEFDVLYINVLDCIKKYFWCIPADNSENLNNISIYDSIRVKMATSISLYNYILEKYGTLENIPLEEIKNAQDKDYFLLIGGDISGIQKYIYALESTDKAAKRLRARSFFIKILSDIGANKIVKELGVTIGNIIISSGGKFYILAQNTEKSVDILEKINAEINGVLYNEYLGELFLNLQWINANGKSLSKEFANKYNELNDKLDAGKNQKFAKEILKSSIIENELYGTGKKVGLCKICRKHLVQVNESSGEGECNICKKNVKFGTALPSISKVAFYNGTIDKKYGVEQIELFGITCCLYKNKAEIEGTPFLVYYYEKRDEILEERTKCYFQDFYGGYTPLYTKEDVDKIYKDYKNIISEEKIEENNVKSFEHIAKETASHNLGILKGDVDNLGLIFSMGMEKNGGTSIGKISTLSRLMDGFFSYWLPKELEKEQKELGSNYVVYSGGDDFMIVGPWDKLIKETAGKINKKFVKYVGENTHITLTCGISITKASDPIYFSSRLASDAEEIGKNAGKDGVVVFGRYVPWSQYDRVMKLADFIEKHLEKDKGDNNDNVGYSQGFIYRLLRYTTMAESYQKTGNSKYLKYISDFTYDIGRNLIPKIAKEYEGQPEEKNRKAIDDERVATLMKYFGTESLNGIGKKFLGEYMNVVLNYAVRKNRKEEK